MAVKTNPLKGAVCVFLRAVCSVQHFWGTSTQPGWVSASLAWALFPWRGKRGHVVSLTQASSGTTTLLLRVQNGCVVELGLGCSDCWQQSQGTQHSALLHPGLSCCEL